MALEDSFIKGANFIRQNERDAHYRQLQNDQNERAQQSHESSLESADLHRKLQAEQNQRNADKHKEWSANSARRTTLADLQVENAKLSQDEYKHNSKRRKVNESREDTLWNQQQNDRLDKENLQWLASNSEQEMFRLKKDGVLSPEFHERSKGTAFDIGRLAEPEYQSSLDFLSQAIDPENKNVDITTPGFLRSMNTVFGPEINKNLGASAHPQSGSPAVKKEIVSVRRAADRPGQFYAEVRVTYEDGSTQDVPMTQGRDSSPDANLTAVDAGDVVQQISARSAFARIVEQSGLKDRYVEFAKQQAAKKRAATAKTAAPNYDGKTMWKGSIVNTKEIQGQYELLGDQYIKPGEYGEAPLVPFDDYIWTAGEDDKLATLMQIAQHNAQVRNHNALADEDEQKPLIDPRVAWAVEQQNKLKKGQEDKNQGTLDKVMQDAPVSKADQHPRNHYRQNQPQEKTPPKDPRQIIHQPGTTHPMDALATF